MTASDANQAHPHDGGMAMMADGSGQPEETSQLCHCPTAICSSAMALTAGELNFSELDFTMVGQLVESDAIVIGRNFVADPPPPRL